MGHSGSSHVGRSNVSADAVALYPMSAYTRGIRKPGHFHVIRFEDGHSERLNRFVPHRHDFFEIIWLRTGSGQVRSDLQNFAVCPRTLFFTSPGQVHAWELAGQCAGEIASFTEEFFAVSSDHPGLLAKLPFLYGGPVPPILCLTPAEGRRVDRLFRQLHADAAQPLLGRDDLVRAYLTILLTLTRQFLEERKPLPSPRATTDLLSRRFRLLLEEKFPELLDVSDYAKRLHVSRTHLNDHLQRETGRSAGELIQDRILLEAKRLLTHTSLTVAQIAYQLGFQDPSYFGRFFRRSAGQTPGEFRDRAQTDLIAS
mgnify:CR=1 FL=1